MKCSKCKSEIGKLNHYFVPAKDNRKAKRYCIKCAREENIVTLV